MGAQTVTGYVPDFDFDLRRGKVGERKVANIVDAFVESRIEVKTDYGADKTGNLYIEYSKQNRAGEWVPSGIATTKADYWAFAFKAGAIVVDTQTLMNLILPHLEQDNIGIRHGNDNSAGSKGVKLPVAELVASLLTSQNK